MVFCWMEVVGALMIGLGGETSSEKRQGQGTTKFGGLSGGHSGRKTVWWWKVVSLEVGLV